MKRKRIVFVCTGNTCRSPMAECVFRKQLKEKKIKFVDSLSAGLFVENMSQINSKSLAVLHENNIDVKDYNAKQLTVKTVNKAYMIVCMTAEHKKIINELYPNFKNVYSASEIIEKDVSDPFGQSVDVYRKCFFELFKLCDNIIQKFIL